MASVNKVIIVGNLGSDPEMRTFPSGDQVANVSVATTSRWKDRDSGELREDTQWHRVVFNGRLAEIAGQYLRKGSSVYIEGELRHRKYEKDGTDHYITEIRSDRMQMLGDPKNGNEQRGGGDRGQGGGRGQSQGGGRGGQQRGGGYDDRGGRGNDRGGYQQRGDNRNQQRNDDNQDRGRGQGGGYTGENNRGGGQARAPAQNTARPPAQQGGGNAGQGGYAPDGFSDMDDDIPF